MGIRNLITFQRRIVITVILGTNDTFLRGIEIYRMSREIGEFVVGPGEEESCILTRCDARYPVDPSHHNPNVISRTVANTMVG